MIISRAPFLSRSSKFWIRLLALLLLSMLLSGLASENSSNVAAQEQASVVAFTTHLDERVPALMNYYRIPGAALALIHHGDVVWLRAYGNADIEAGRAMTTDALFKVGSISKSVTAWGVMTLVEQGQIELDSPVGQYLQSWQLPESAFSEEAVTVRQLLSLSAGMPLGAMGQHYSPHEVIPSLEESLSRDAVLRQEPGASFYYSNTSFNLLELLIEEVTDRDFADYMQEEVFLPLGMLHSSFDWGEAFDAAIPSGYDLQGNPVPVYVYPERASGGLFSTVGDIATFVAAGMNVSHTGHHVLSSQSISSLYTPVVAIPGFYGLAFDAYGLGHFIENLPNGKQAVSHGGQGYGWMTHFHSIPETGEGIVILTNSQRSWPFFAHVLSDWANWSGLHSVGMARIILGERALWGLVGLLVLIVLWQAWRLGQGLYSGRRHFAPFSRTSRFLRLTQVLVFGALVTGLVWANNQDYLFIASVFPVAFDWLSLSVLALAVSLLLLALFPRLKPGC